MKKTVQHLKQQSGIFTKKLVKKNDNVRAPITLNNSHTRVPSSLVVSFDFEANYFPNNMQ